MTWAKIKADLKKPWTEKGMKALYLMQGVTMLLYILVSCILWVLGLFAASITPALLALLYHRLAESIWRDEVERRIHGKDAIKVQTEETEVE